MIILSYEISLIRKGTTYLKKEKGDYICDNYEDFKIEIITKMR